jgi:hypothetical protein
MSAPIVLHQEIVVGDDYKIADERALTWFSASWPNLAGAKLALVVGYSQANIYAMLPVTWAYTMPAGPETRTAVMELTATQTKQVFEGCFDYILQATLTDGSHVTLVLGELTVSQEPGQAPLAP